MTTTTTPDLDLVKRVAKGAFESASFCELSELPNKTARDACGCLSCLAAKLMEDLGIAPWAA